jgi:hypothetical protein
MQPLLAWHIVAVTGGYGAALAAGGLAAWAALAHVVGRWDDDQRGRDLRAATQKLACGAIILTAVAIVLGAVWARDHLGRYWGWDLKEVGGIAVTAWSGLMLCAALFGPPTGRRQNGATAALILLGVGGNIVVSLSWFGPPLVMGSGRGPGPGYGPYLAGFVAVQVMLMAGHLIRSGGAPAR